METALPAVRLGRTWFQYRSFGPLPLLFLVIVLPPNFTPSPAIFALSLMGIAAAELLRIWAVGYAGSVTRTRGDHVPDLVRAGPFRYVRNPLYIANIAMYTLISVAFGFSYLSLFGLVYFAVQYTFIVRFEESTLSRLFGGSYARFCEEVPRWWPSLTPIGQPSQHPFELKKALRSERSTLIALVAIAVIYLIKSAYLTA